MLLLIFAGVVFLFLLLGSVVFFACVLIPRARQYALSAALWCALWGPCSVTLMVIAGAGLITAAMVDKTGNGNLFHAPTLLSAFGWSYLIIGALITTLVATATAWIHQAMINRVTFALFRLYATAVSAGIGSVFGWSFGWWIMSRDFVGYIRLPIWGVSMLAMVVEFGLAAYRGAHSLRAGQVPETFNWISSAEFAGR